MADNISVPINIEDPVILRRFLNELVGKYNSTSNRSLLKEVLGLTDTQLNNFNDAVTLSFLDAIKNNTILQNTIKQLVKETVVTNLVQSCYKEFPMVMTAYYSSEPNSSSSFTLPLDTIRIISAKMKGTSAGLLS